MSRLAGDPKSNVRPDEQEPTPNEWGAEEHPAWGLIGASRVSAGPPGVSLFDSDIRHQHFIQIRLSRAQRKRDLHRDWLGATKVPILEIAVSEAQWASFVSTMNAGDGVPCTIELTEQDGYMPRFPHEQRLQESMAEVEGAAERAAQQVADAFAAYAEKKTAANLRNLESAIRNMPANITFAAASLTEHAENVVQRSTADIEAAARSAAERLGLNAEQARHLLPSVTDEES